jgi:hypothetical protein
MRLLANVTWWKFWQNSTEDLREDTLGSTRPDTDSSTTGCTRGVTGGDANSVILAQRARAPELGAGVWCISRMSRHHLPCDLLYSCLYVHGIFQDYYLQLILKGSEDGVLQSGMLSFWTLSTVWYSKKHTFQKLDLFSFSGVRKEAPTLLSPFERAKLRSNNWG